MAYAIVSPVATKERESMAPYAVKCGRNIRLYRQAKGLDQTALAELLEVNQGTISKWEQGDRLPRDFYRARLAHELDVDLDKIFPPTSKAAVA